MPKLPLFDIKGKTTTKIDLPKEIFGVEKNSSLIAQAVRVYLSNQRTGQAKARGRGDVSGSGIKIYKQKGTGKARHGDKYAPIFVGGGSAHGPDGTQNYHLKMSQKMRQKALFCTLSAKLKEEKIVVVKGLEKIEPKTKKMMSVLKNLKMSGKISVIMADNEENITRAARNIAKLQLLKASDLNTYQVLNGGTLLLVQESIAKIKQVFLK